MRRCGLTLRLDLILNDEGLALVVNLLGELGRDGVVSGRVLDDETLVALHALQDGRLLDGPLAHVGPVFLRRRILLLSMRRGPPGGPVLGELLQERRLQRGRLGGTKSAIVEKPRRKPSRQSAGRFHPTHTVKVGFSATDEASALGSASSA